MFRQSLMFVAAAVVAAACGGGDGGPASPNPNNNGSKGTMSARIDGAQWTAIAVGVSVNAGSVIVSGSNGTSTGLGIAFSRLNGTGTQVFGTNAVSLGTMTQGAMAWSTATRRQ